MSIARSLSQPVGRMGSARQFAVLGATPGAHKVRVENRPRVHYQAYRSCSSCGLLTPNYRISLKFRFKDPEPRNRIIAS
ncbi:hypothetical protein NDU88_007850 [Pleurodeles waltl]|uniref:Uncharacterized protein n=1 Tax=Pleurodeles waltl TaxID=8319 RepID=A0AAV7VVK3_PLEWA|nr:hypothetical protein NDU88_007850 [Pleurodeles waltl]